MGFEEFVEGSKTVPLKPQRHPAARPRFCVAPMEILDTRTQRLCAGLTSAAPTALTADRRDVITLTDASGYLPRHAAVPSQLGSSPWRRSFPTTVPGALTSPACSGSW